MSDFNILIGVDMTNAENDIKKSIEKIGESYKLKLDMIIGNKDVVFKQIRTIQDLFSKLGKLDIDFGLKEGSKDILNIKDKLEGMANIDLSDVGDDLSKSLDKAKTKLKAVHDEYGKLMKLVEKEQNNTLMSTEISGDKFLSKRQNKKSGLNGNVIEEKTPEPPTYTRNFEALESYVNKAMVKINSMKNVANSNLNDVSNLVERLTMLNAKLANGDEGFHDEVKAINDLIEHYDKLEREMIEVNKTRETQAREAIKWANKLADVERQNYANPSSKGALKRRIGELENGDFKNLDELQKKLQQIQNQYAKIQGQEKNIAFGRKVVNEYDKIDKKINSGKLDSKYVSKKDSADLNEAVDGVKTAKNMVQLENALKRVNKQYDDMLKKQAQAIEKEALEEKIRRIRVSTHDWGKEINRIKSEGFVNESEFESVRKSMQALSADSKTYEQDLKRVATQINRLNQLSVKRAERQETRDISKGRNNDKIESMRGTVPDNILNDVKGLNDMLDFSSSKKDIAFIEDEMKKLVKLNDDIVKAGKDEAKIRQAIEEHQQSAVKSADKYVDTLAEIVQNSNRQIQDATKRNQIEQEAINIQREINDLRERGTQLSYEEQRAIQQRIQALRRLAQRQRDVESDENGRDNTTQRLRDKFNSVSYRATRGFGENSTEARKLKETIRDIEQMVDGLSGKVGSEFHQATREIEEAMNRLNAESRRLRDEDQRRRNSTSGQLVNALKKVPIWAAAMGVVYGAVEQIKRGFQSVLDIDAAMINLAKVSEASKQQLDEFKNTASEMGRGLGVVATDVINATTAFQKLGYTLEQSTMLGKNSILYANVGDMDVQTASDNLTGTIQGFGIEVDEAGNNVRKVVDMFNEVSNNFAITAEGIGQVMTRSAAVMHQAGNTMEETVALAASANAIIQNPTKVGNSLKTVAMRLRGITEEGEAVEEIGSKLQITFDRINKEFGLMGEKALQVMEDDGNTFKSTYKIFEQVEGIWNKLSDLERANLTELMGGKQQGNVVAAIIQNWDDAEKAARTAANSSGSAMQEFNAYMDGFEYKIGQLKNALERFWTTVIDDDTVKMLIDSLTSIIDALTKLVETLGAMPIIAVVGGLLGLLASKGLRESVLTVTNLGGAFKGFGTWVLNAVKLIPRLIPYIGVLLAIGEAANLVFKWMTADSRARKERLKVLDAEISKLQEFKDAYDETLNTKDFNLDDFAKLQAKGTARSTEEEQKYLETINKIKDTMPQLIAYYDEKGNAVIKNATEIRNLINTNEDLLLQNEKEQLKLNIDETSFKDVEDKLRRISDAQGQLGATEATEKMTSVAKQYLENEVKEINESNYTDVLDEFKNRIMQAYDSLSEEEKNYTQKQYQAIQNIIPRAKNKDEALQILQGAIKDNETMRQFWQDDVNKTKDSIRLGSDEIIKQIDQAYNIATRERKVDSNSNTFLFIDQLKQNMIDNLSSFGTDVEATIKSIPDYIDQAISDIESHGVTIDDILTTPETEDDLKRVRAQIEDIRNELYKTDPNNPMIQAYDALILKHTQAYNTVKNAPIQPFEFLKDVMNPVQEFISEISDLDSAYRTLSDGQELSLSTTMDLITKHPELMKSMKMENGVLKITAESIKKVAKEREREVDADLRGKRKQLEAAVQKAKQQIKADEAEIRSLQNKMRAYQIANNAIAGVEVDNPYKDSLSSEDQKNLEMQQLAKKTGLPLFNNSAWQDKLIETQEKEMEAKNDQINANKKNIKDMNDQINSLDALIGQDFTSQLGSIGSIPKEKKEKEKKELQDAIYVVDKYAKKMDGLNRLIEKQQKLQGENSTWTNAHKKAINEEIYLTDQKRKAIDAEIASLQKQIKAKNIQKTGLIQINGNENENKTQRAIAAELQQEIDQAENRLRDLGSESDDTKTRINELRMMQVQANLDTFDMQREVLSDDIAYQEYAMSLYDETTQAYRNHANEKLKLLKDQQKTNKEQLAYMLKEKEVNKNLTNAEINDLNALIRASREGIYEMDGQIKEMETLIADSGLQKYMWQMANESKKYADAISDIQDQIKYDLGDDGDYGKHIDFLKQIVELRKGERADILKNIKYLEKQLVLYGDNKEMVEKISSELETWKDSLKDTENGIKDTNLEIKSVYEKISERYVELYKEQLQLMQKADEKHYQDKIKAEQKAHDNRLKQIDAEMKALQEAYDKQMKLIDRAEAARTHDQDSNKLQDEANELKKQIDLLSMDDSYAAKAKKAELVKELSEKEMELAELNHDREVDLRKDNLEDDLDAEMEKLEARKNRYQDDLDNLVESLEEQANKKREYWEAELNNEKKFAELRKQVMDGNFDAMFETIDTWSESVSGRMAELGQQVTENFTYKVQEAIDSMKDLSTMKIGSLTNSTTKNGTQNFDADKKPTATTPKENELSDKDIISEMRMNSKRWKDAKTEEERKTYYDANQKLGASIGATYKNGSWYKGGKKLYELRTGGYTGDWSGDGGRLAVLHKKELVLNEDQTKHILDTARIMEKVKSITPTASLLNNVPKATSHPAIPNTSEHNEYNIEVNVNGNADKKVADTVADQIVNKIKRTKGGRF
ncbi:phage tail tape measure protein [Paenibacillus lautus]|uniref:phage tail tape measure protein n=1 Tax=Paenibacillus lautus TaxID=1401 RepID=UPI003D274A23